VITNGQRIPSSAAQDMLTTSQLRVISAYRLRLRSAATAFVIAAGLWLLSCNSSHICWALLQRITCSECSFLSLVLGIHISCKCSLFLVQVCPLCHNAPSSLQLWLFGLWVVCTGQWSWPANTGTVRRVTQCQAIQSAKLTHSIEVVQHSPFQVTRESSLLLGV